MVNNNKQIPIKVYFFLVICIFTRTKYFHDQIKKHVSSGKISAINAKGLGKTIIPIPSPETQTEIVRILDAFTLLSAELTTESNARNKQYNYYRDLLLNFPKPEVEA